MPRPRLAMRCSLDAVTDRHGHDALWYLLAFDEILDPSIPEWTFDTRNSFGV